MSNTRLPEPGSQPVPSYGWVVVAVSATVNSLAWSVRSTFALFYVALLAEFGWRRGDAALGYSLSWLLLLVFSPLAGRLSDRWGARLVVPIGGLILAAAVALTGQVTALWHYLLVFGVMGAAGIGFIQTPATALVNRWFLRSRGAAMGVVSAGASASAIVFYPLNAWLIVTYGWRVALVLFGVVLALGTIPLAAMFYREPPDDREDAGAGRSQLSTRGDGEWTLRLALRSTPFWAVSSMWALGVITSRSPSRPWPSAAPRWPRGSRPRDGRSSRRSPALKRDARTPPPRAYLLHLSHYDAAPVSWDWSTAVDPCTAAQSRHSEHRPGVSRPGLEVRCLGKTPHPPALALQSHLR